MFLLRTIYINQQRGYPSADNGIWVGVLERVRKVFVKEEFWGKTEITLENNSDFCFNPTKKGEYVLLPYVNSYEIEELADGFKKFNFIVGQQNSSEFEGFIVFIESSPTKIETDCETLFNKTPNQIVAILREGQYLKFGRLHFEILNQDLFYFGRF